MENNIIYFSDFPNLQKTGTRKDNGKFDLTLLPTQELKEEFRGYIMYRCKNGTLGAVNQDRTAYNHMADETREVRQMMSDIIYMSLAGWGEEYEQIRQDD